jgi:hypothetical protein
VTWWLKWKLYLLNAGSALYYRPPSHVASVDLEDVFNCLNLLMGDFDINWSANNSSGLKDTLQNLADAFCFKQLVLKLRVHQLI